MAQFQMKIAGAVACVESLFDSTPQYFRSYLTEEAPQFSIVVQPSDLRFEQEELDAEAVQEGFRFRRFTDPFLERTAIQRAFAEYLLGRDTLLLHGSAVAVDAEGYLFTARSGTGKSTHTRLWRQVFDQRCVIINDDKPFVQMAEGGATIFGSPWSGKHGLDSNIAVPLRGICILERGAENCIRPICADQALPMLGKQSYQPLTASASLLSQALVAKLADAVPLWHMTCSISPQAAQIAYEAMSAK